MAKLPQQPEIIRNKCLQININSEDDAKAVIQHLQLIKRTFDTLADSAGIDAISFCIAETMRKKVEDTLTGAIRWCRTYVKSVAPFEGNVHFPLPHYVPPNVQITKTVASNPQSRPEQAAPAQKVNRYLKNILEPAESQVDETPGKSKRPVRAEPAGT